MPTQAEKSLPKPPAERATKAKKKKKRESGRSSKNSHSKKHTASEADSSSEGLFGSSVFFDLFQKR